MISGVTALAEVAPAKVNLALHVIGRRADGFHLLDSLVVFTELGDRLTASHDEGITLSLDGPMAAGLTTSDNLVVRAAEALRIAAGDPRLGARLVLEKHLPVASGIGGGSADAAATVRLLTRLWRLDTKVVEMARLAAGLGADVPVCMASHPARMGGIGEILEPFEGLPDLPLVLVNPRRAVSTPEVFRRLARRDNAGLPALPSGFATPRDVADYLARCRNDLEAPATALEPVIAEAIAALAATPGCLIARMSGSGATCFGIYPDAPAAATAAAALAGRHPGWWVISTVAGATA